jgi:hypothetical protein
MGALGAVLLVAALSLSGPTETGRADSGPSAEQPASPGPRGTAPAESASASSLPDSAVTAARAARAAGSDTAAHASPSPRDSSMGAAESPPAPARLSKAHAASSRRARAATTLPARGRPAEAAAEADDTNGPAGAHSVQAANAETGESEAERVAREIARTAMWLARAGSLVQKSRNEKAEDTLDSAREFQGGARDAYEVQQYARAQRLTQAARDYAERAIRMAGPATDDPEYVKTVLRHTDDALDRLKDYLEADGGASAQRRYEALKEDQRDARELLEGGDARAAYKATTRVRDGVLVLLRNAPPGEVPCGSARKAIENAEESRGRVRKDIGPHPDGATSHYLAAADQQLARARALLDHRNCRDAVLRAKAAERQLEKAIDASRQARQAKK